MLWEALGTFDERKFCCEMLNCGLCSMGRLSRLRLGALRLRILKVDDALKYGETPWKGSSCMGKGVNPQCCHGCLCSDIVHPCTREGYAWRFTTFLLSTICLAFD